MFKHMTRVEVHKLVDNICVFIGVEKFTGDDQCVSSYVHTRARAHTQRSVS